MLQFSICIVNSELHAGSASKFTSAWCAEMSSIGPALNRRLDGPQSRLGEDKNLLPLPRFEPLSLGRRTPSLFTKLDLPSSSCINLN